MQNIQRKPLGLTERGLIGGIIFVVLLLVGVEISGAAEILPSIGFSHPAKGGASKFYTGVALRSGLAPFIHSELGVAYRRDDVANGLATATTWPVTASIWAAPIPFLYAGGGVGWYSTSYSFPGAPAGASLATTQQSFGTHVGGGMRMPIAPMLALDLNARYVMVEKPKNSSIPSSYDPKFWSAALGLGVKF